MRENSLGRLAVVATVLTGCTLGTDRGGSAPRIVLGSLSQTTTLRSPEGRSIIQAGGNNFIVEGNGSVVSAMHQSSEGGDWQPFGPTCDLSANSSVASITTELSGPNGTRGIRCEGSGPGQPVDVTLCTGSACDALR